MNYSFHQRAIAIAVIGSLTACSTLESQVLDLKQKNAAKIEQYQQKAQEKVPVVTSANRPWIMGSPVQLAEPMLPILKQNVTYHPTNMVSLADVASWVTQKTGLVVDIAELQTGSNGLSGSTSALGGASGLGQVGAQPSTSYPGTTATTYGTSNYAQPQTMWSMTVNFNGPLSGLLDVAANKSSAWWKVVDGRIVFYRYESKTFYFPAIARKFSSDSTITSKSGATGGTSGTVTTGTTPSGGANFTSNYLVDTWADLEETAKIVGAGAQVAANRSAGSITVTGTPAQVRHVEKWAKEQVDQQSQQVAITMYVYSVQVTNEENYNWNPTVVFKNVASTYGFNISGPQAPAIISGTNPSKLNVNFLQSTSGTEPSDQWSGSQLAFQALSSLGEITETIEQTVVTLNGQPMPIQIANTQGYLASSSTTTTADVGATATLTPGSLTTGFTALFVPRVVNGKIILGMNMQNSSNKGFTTITSGGSSIQNPNFDSNGSEQIASLTPGDALLLTGIQRDNGQVRKSGVGKANNYALGGGIGNNNGKQMIAIVITGKIL